MPISSPCAACDWDAYGISCATSPLIASVYCPADSTPAAIAVRSQSEVVPAWVTDWSNDCHTCADWPENEVRACAICDTDSCVDPEKALILLPVVVEMFPICSRSE